MPSSTSVPTSVRLDPKLRDQLREAAKRRRWSLNTMVTTILAAWIKAEEEAKE